MSFPLTGSREKAAMRRRAGRGGEGKCKEKTWALGEFHAVLLKLDRAHSSPGDLVNLTCGAYSGRARGLGASFLALSQVVPRLLAQRPRSL